MKIIYSVVARMAHRIKVTVNQNGFIVSQKMKNEEGTEIIYFSDTEVLYEDIKARADFADHSCYNIFEGKLGVFNMFANSKSAKLSGQDFALFNRGN